MDYHKAIFTLSCREEDRQTASDLLIDLAGEAGFEAFEETNGQVVGYVQPHLFCQNLLDEQLSHFPLPHVSISYTLSSAENKNWNALWEEVGFAPIVIQNECVVYDARHTHKEQLPADLSLKIGIETRQAFGTGTHQTTQLVISQLLRLDINGKAVLDCGCGTGILGIVAAKMGARNVMAYDIDEWSVENTRHNAELNKVENLSVYQGDATILSTLTARFDLVLADINRNILLADMSHFKAAMRPGALLILSGFYEEDLPLLLEEAEKWQLTEVHRSEQDRWACLVLQ